MKNIRIVYKAPRADPEERTVSNKLHELQGLVEGDLEQVSGLTGGYALFCNEEGKLNGMMPNIVGLWDIIVGPVFVGKADEEGELVSLSDADVQKVTATLKAIDIRLIP